MRPCASGTGRRQRLVERDQQLSDGGAYFAGQRAVLIEIGRVRPGPQAPHFDAGTQMGVSAAEAPEECAELLVILGTGVLALPELEVAAQVEPLAYGGVPVGELATA